MPWLTKSGCANLARFADNGGCMDYIRGRVIQALAVAVIAVSGCSSGSGDSGGANQGADISGIYKFTGEVANITCSDGTITRKGYGITGELIQDGEFLLFKSNGQTFGRGHLSADGVFHLSATIEESGYTIAAVLDGKAAGKEFTGLSRAAWTTDTGLSCHQITQFTGTPQDGGA